MPYYIFWDIFTTCNIQFTIHKRNIWYFRYTSTYHFIGIFDKIVYYTYVKFQTFPFIAWPIHSVAQVVSGKIAHFQRYETIGDIADGLSSSNPRRSVQGWTKLFHTLEVMFSDFIGNHEWIPVLLLMVQKFCEKTTVWMVYKTIVNNGIDKLPTSNWWFSRISEASTVCTTMTWMISQTNWDVEDFQSPIMANWCKQGPCWRRFLTVSGTSRYDEVRNRGVGNGHSN